MGDYIYSGDHKRLEKKDYEDCINKIFDVLKELPKDKHYYASYEYCLEEVLEMLKFRNFNNL